MVNVIFLSCCKILDFWEAFWFFQSFCWDKTWLNKSVYNTHSWEFIPDRFEFQTPLYISWRDIISMRILKGGGLECIGCVPPPPRICEGGYVYKHILKICRSNTLSNREQIYQHDKIREYFCFIHKLTGWYWSNFKVK